MRLWLIENIIELASGFDRFNILASVYAVWAQFILKKLKNSFHSLIFRILVCTKNRYLSTCIDCIVSIRRKDMSDKIIST